MQTKEQIQYLLQHQYSSNHWKAFLSELFTTSHFYSNPTRLTSINASIASDAFHIGNITLSENGISRHIAVYEVVLAPNVVLERNRVGLRNLLKMHGKSRMPRLLFITNRIVSSIAMLKNGGSAMCQNSRNLTRRAST